ncbi:MAG: hypothetical protein R3E42_01720 [Burkholderiaceae bacterium]
MAAVFAAATLTLMGQFGPQAHAATAYTVIEAVQVPAWVETEGQRRPALQPGQALRINDKAVTAEASRMLLRLPDQSVIKLGEKTEFQIQSLSNQRAGVAQPSEMKAALRVDHGRIPICDRLHQQSLGQQARHQPSAAHRDRGHSRHRFLVHDRRRPRCGVPV